MEAVNGVITNIIPEIAGTVVEHILYPFQVDNKVRDLECATRDLVALKEDVKTKIEVAERQNGSRTKQVVEWLNKVESVVKEAEEIKRPNRKRRWSFWSSYTTSNSAVKKLCEVKNLCDQKSTIEVTMHLPPPLAQEMPASSSKSPNLKSTLLFVNDDVHSIIGIWGMGGVGKTHLLKQINNELCRDRPSDVVVFVTCSKDCSEEKVQNEILDKLRLDKYGSIEQKQNTIYNFLRERSFVLLLDDLWGRVDLDTIGIPDPMSAIGKLKRKVVLTTRSTEVCGQMEVKKKIRVDVLKWDDAWSLFNEKVTEETIDSDPLIKIYAVDIVKELGGLPLAIITVGRAMHDKMDRREWEQAIVLLKQARLNDVEFSHANQSVFHILKFSYDSLKNDSLKQCFLHCSLWPEDHPIQKNDLVELWIGLGLINESNIQAAYNVGYSYIRRLQAVCLLEIDDDYTINSDDTVKIHDVIRDMALWIANNKGVDTINWIVRSGIFKEAQEIQISHHTEKLSVMNIYEGNLSFSFTCSSTKLSTLLLSHNSLHNLKTLKLELFSKLTFLNLYNNRLQFFPVEICKLVHLQYLNLSKNSLKSLPEELAKLTNLKYLLLRGIECTFPNEVLSKLKILRVLDLSDCYSDDYVEIFPMLEKVLQCVPNFQALGITICSIIALRKFHETMSVPIRWLDVRSYERSCLSFSSSFLGNSQLQSNLFSLKIRASASVECVEFESASEDQSICHLRRLEQLYFEAMWNMNEVKWKSLDPKDVFPRLQVVEFNACHKLISISWVVNLPCIRELRVLSCYSIKQLICINELKNSGFNVSQHSFPFLKILHLYYGYELESISDPMITFPALEFLDIDDCDKLKKLPFRTDDPPRKLKIISGSEEWWNNVEIEDNHRSSLQPFFKRL
ncbi:Disease resistance protein RPS5 [Rhynchospora pubera]|uniref:Disease resistance protein RPS5 n=1 Tax=Rhynchospora pubera TaxID=906938 RepID=A0AAV8EKH2_9POAL|nr:Disease resistance protein RPS5 [Rhynchospora pubera]